MRMCDDHWTKLRAAITEHGLDHLIPESGEAAAKRMFDFTANKTPTSFDPLMSANNMIFTNGLDAVGLSLMQGDKCPLCEIDKLEDIPEDVKGCDSETWVRMAAEGSKSYAEENGLL